MVKTTGRSPIDKSGDVRDKIWKVIRELRSFSVRDVEDKTSLNERTILSYFEALVLAGILDREIENIEGNGSLKKSTFSLVKDKGVDAPRVRRDGSLVPETNQTKMWKVIRVMRSFDLKTLIATASTQQNPISPSTADLYLRELKKAGYLLKKAQERTYRINPAMDFGPKAPLIQKTKQIYDPNIKKVVWSNDGEKK